MRKGDVQGLKAWLSRLQAKVPPVSLEVKVISIARAGIRPEGALVIDVCGGVVSGGDVSTVNVRVAGVWSWLPAASSARKVAVWGPSVRAVKVFGEVQSTKEPESIRHWILAVSPAGLPANVNAAWFVLMVPVGPELIVVSGAVGSTVKVRLGGFGSVFAATSVARTRKVCEPSARLARVLGEEQEVKTAESRLHSKLEGDSLEENAKVGVRLVIVEP
jgi:hypothetical protein